MDPEDTSALNIRAIARRNSNDRDAAEQSLRDALTIDPNDALTHANLGWNAFDRGDRGEAEHHFREALRLNPNLEWARRGVIEMLKSKNPLYRIMLSYFVWIQRKSSAYQWLFIIGLYVLYRTAFFTLKNHPEWGIVLWPLIILYLLFAFSTFFTYPLGNLCLLLHPFGRLALNRREKRQAFCVGITLLVFVGAALTIAIAGWESDVSDPAFYVGLASLSTAISFLVRPGAGKWMAVYLAVLFIATLLTATAPMVLSIIGEDPKNWPAWAPPWILLAFVARQWVPYSLLTTIAMLILMNRLYDQD